MESKYLDFWDRVCELLKQKKMSHKTLAELADIDTSSISKGIKHKNSPNAYAAVRIALALNTTVEYLVQGTRDALNKDYNSELNHLYEYMDFIEHLESLPKYMQQEIKENIIQVAENRKRDNVNF